LVKFGNHWLGGAEENYAPRKSAYAIFYLFLVWACERHLRLTPAIVTLRILPNSVGRRYEYEQKMAALEGMRESVLQFLPLPNNIYSVHVDSSTV
jgi:hypothetical protein